MSVPTWRRDLSKADYMYQTYKLCIRIGEIVVNAPKKYRQNYGDHLINVSLEALEDAQIANSIFVSKNMSKTDYAIRRTALKKMMGKVHNISTSFKLYKDLIKKCDGENPVKLNEQEQEIGERCAYTISLIKGIIESDRNRLRQPHKGDS